jgi:2-oxo-4-hydroxy-4-carboxy-5-ureidoimidazoline decarboxylase
MTIEELNNLSTKKTIQELLKCCGSSVWVGKLTNNKPFKNKQQLLEVSDRIWSACSKHDGLEAFTHHPKIGDLKSLEKKFASTKEWAGKEQAGVDSASHKTLVELAEGNQTYENKFGYIFIVCATGKTANEMLTMLQSRLQNNPEAEIKIAMNEQNKITHIRLEKLIA